MAETTMPVPGHDRMPPIPDADLTAAQRSAVEGLAAGPRGALFGPFVPLLRSPAAMDHLQRLGAYLRFESPLPRALFEMAVLMTARARDQEFEWVYHAPLAREAGLSTAAIEALAQGVEPADLDPLEGVAYRLVSEALQSNTIGDATYADSIAHLGEQCTIDLMVTTGYYSTLAMVMNLARTPVPDDLPRLVPLPVPVDGGTS